MTPAQTLALAAASAASTAVEELIEVGRGNADAGDLRQNEIVELLQDAVKMVRQIVGEPKAGGSADERLIETMIDAYEAAPGVRQHTAMKAALAAIRASGYALVRTEGEEWEAMVERAWAAEQSQPTWPCRDAMRAALRAALNPGADT